MLQKTGKGKCARSGIVVTSLFFGNMCAPSSVWSAFQTRVMVSPWLSLLAAFTWLLCVKIDIFLKIILNERARCSCPGFMMSLAGFVKVIQTPQTEVRYMLHIFKGGLSSVKTYAEA